MVSGLVVVAFTNLGTGACACFNFQQNKKSRAVRRCINNVFVYDLYRTGAFAAIPSRSVQLWRCT